MHTLCAFEFIRWHWLFGLVVEIGKRVMKTIDCFVRSRKCSLIVFDTVSCEQHAININLMGNFGSNPGKPRRFQ